MENQEIAKIKHTLKELKELADHSKTMSIGARLLINKRCENIQKELEIIELKLMMLKE